MTPENFDAITSQAVLVVAHPDDEALWFSAILCKVKRIIICFLETASDTATTINRISASKNYPLANVSFIDLKESGVYEKGDWTSMTPTRYGIQLEQGLDSRSKSIAKAYALNFELLSKRLAKELRGEKYVFTHNPWGEYGHEEHIQVFCAIQSLQEGLAFRIFCSNYCSDKTMRLLLKHAERIHYPGNTLSTDTAISKKLMDLYLTHNCWTWLENYQWPAQETFFEIQKGSGSNQSNGNALPLIFLRLEKNGVEHPRGVRRILDVVASIASKATLFIKQLFNAQRADRERYNHELQGPF